MALPLRHWDAITDKPRAIVIALHGMSDYSNAFDGPGKNWAAQGITTLAYDQRGFGRGPDPGSWAGDDVLRDDFRDFVAATRAHYPGVPLFAPTPAQRTDARRFSRNRAPFKISFNA